jgi:nucleotide-binding universal stress UspA family protein
MEELMTTPSVSTKRVLFATDFSDYSAAALPYALTLACTPGGKLVVAHVVAMGPLRAGFPAHAWLVVSAQAVREARASMQQLAGRLNGVVHQTLVRSGDICGEISAMVREESIDVLVLGTHGRTGIRKAVFGSVAEKLFRHARCPVLTIGPNVSAGPQGVQQLHSILYPTDFSQEAQPALAHALSLARAHGARLYLLHAAKAGRGWDKSFIEEQLCDLAPAEAGLACEPKALVRTGSPGQAILDVAKELAVDLIVMGPKRHSGMPGTMATAYQVVAQATCPVLTVRG